jgi:hypothetical protein
VKYFITFFILLMGQVGVDLNRSPASIKKSTKSCFEILELFSAKEIKQINLPITVEDNLKFIKIIKSKSYNPNEVFWHLDNTVLKALNDKVYHDKKITHGITIFFQQIMLRKIMDNSILGKYLSAKYFDYKTLRLSFLGLDQALLSREMLKIFQEANQELEIYLKERALDTHLRTAPFLARNFNNWFAQGIAHRPDLASLVARLARNNSQENLIKVYSYNEKNEIIKLQFDSTKKINIEITHMLSYDPKGFIWSDIEVAGNKTRALSRDFLDLMRKGDFYSSEGREELLLKINHFAGTSLNEKSMGLLLQFINYLDYFSISILQKETTKLDWLLAKNGFVSVDFTKKGAEGLQWVHANLIDSRNVNEMMEKGREAFWSVDKSIQDGVKDLTQVVSKINYQSGDDLVLFLKENYRGNKIIKKLQELLLNPQVATWRVVLYRGRIAQGTGDIIRDNGELFQKQYRNDLDWKFARSTQEEVITFVEIDNNAEGMTKKVFYRVVNKEIEAEVEEWHKSFSSDIEFIKI